MTRPETYRAQSERLAGYGRDVLDLIRADGFASPVLVAMSAGAGAVLCTVDSIADGPAGPTVTVTTVAGDATVEVHAARIALVEVVR